MNLWHRDAQNLSMIMEACRHKLPTMEPCLKAPPTALLGPAFLYWMEILSFNRKRWQRWHKWMVRQSQLLKGNCCLPLGWCPGTMRPELWNSNFQIKLLFEKHRETCMHVNTNKWGVLIGWLGSFTCKTGTAVMNPAYKGKNSKAKVMALSWLQIENLMQYHGLER